MITALREYATHWLKPAMPGECEIVGKVVLEQIRYTVPPAHHTWLLRVGPTSLDQAAACLENYTQVEKSNVRPEGAAPDRPSIKAALTGQKTGGPPLLRMPLPTTLRPHSVRVPQWMHTRWQGHPSDRATRQLVSDQTHGELTNGTPPNYLSRAGPCYLCGQMGHLRRNCSRMECEIGWEVYPPGAVRPYKPPPLTISMRLGKKVITALIDTGNSVSLI